MRTLISLGTCMVFSLGTALAEDVVLQQNVNGDSLVITASGSRFAGSIYSVNFRGKEYINSSDHGRELQSASSFDGLGECFNPTEAGSKADGSKQTSSSALISHYVSGSSLYTSTNMAFWLLPGENYGKPCGSTQYTTAQNSTVLSRHLLSKVVSIGYQGIQNIIRYETSFTVPEMHQSAVFEAVTGYMPVDFSVFLTYEPSSRRLTSAEGQGEQSKPVVLATADGRHAMGVFSFDLPQTGHPNVGYGRFHFTDTNKWNCVFRHGEIAAGSTYTYNCFIAIGTVDEIMAAENSLYGSSGSPTPLFRFFNGKDHFITSIYREAASAGYKFEGTAFHVYLSSFDAGMVSLYRCRMANGDHFASLSQLCEGQAYEGRYGYISSVSRDGFSPLYRLFNSISKDHLITTNSSEGLNSGYHLEMTLGYVN